MVPMLAASPPSAAQIWRVKAATEVLPLVPVTAAIVAGWRGWKRAAASASARRTLSARTNATSSCSFSAPRSAGGQGEPGDKTQQRRDAGNDLPSRRRRIPAGCRVAVRIGGGLRLVEQDGDEKARLVGRQPRHEGGEQLGLGIAPVDDLLGG